MNHQAAEGGNIVRRKRTKYCNWQKGCLPTRLGFYCRRRLALLPVKGRPRLTFKLRSRLSTPFLEDCLLRRQHRTSRVSDVIQHNLVYLTHEF
jgi:hypothetical protein